MWTFLRKTVCAIAPPISAAAMLSRKADSTKTMASSAKAPFQSSGRKRGSACGTSLRSKWSARSAKPTSRQKRLTMPTHSWSTWATSPATPGPSAKPVKISL